MEKNTIIKLLLSIPVIILIIVLLVVAFQQYNISKANNAKGPCWMCGYTEGKACFQQFPDKSIQNDQEAIHNWLVSIANNNTIKETKWIYDEPKYDVSEIKLIPAS